MANVPTFRALLERQGIAGVADTLVAGDETAVEAEIRRFADAGATELVMFPAGRPEDEARTVALLAGVNGGARR